MESWMIVLIMGCVIVLFLLVGAPMKPMRFIGRVLIRVIVAMLCLFLVNSLTGLTGFFLPINIMTSLTVAFLGLPGLLLLVAVQQFILP
ncbi:pro-sigmaK processing inhibitor BofA family protein [Shouchella lonarensis]|uniref:Inhibitor of the pro-sigma K processing machinery n=1 Tax=Shouchella lonarensis TaxID=1464122 RepID=A0A1G6NXQ6_9BACI|nr:pro-sigmaK processing inhibitor BofA family protein [Shouchella lonarensis]SDC72528.1 inhibitor of the pro-sigma K processing machinery [Shouchella lonarensis]